MKKLIALALMLLLMGCSMNKEHAEMKKDSELYNLALSLKSKIPALDPDKNQTIVETKDFNLNVADIMFALKAAFGNMSSSISKSPVEKIKNLIHELGEKAAMKKILVTEAQKLDLSISDSEFDSLINVQYAHVGGKEKFAQMMKQRGIDEDVFLKDSKNAFLIQKYFDHIKQKNLTLSDDDVRKFVLEDTRSVRHILLLTQGKSQAEKKKIYRKMQKIRKRALKGEDFSKLAQEYTEDRGSKQTGGLYEYFPRGMMVKPFEEAAFNLEPGKISDIIETVYGYHILTVIDRTQDLQKMDSLKKVLEPRINEKKEKTVAQNAVDSLKKVYAIKIIEL